MSWLLAILALGFLVMIHEFGHFIVAKLSGMKVDVFSIGFGPPIPGCRWVKDGTEFVISWVPLGGYVKIAGSNPDDEEDYDPEDPRAFLNQPVWKRMAVVAAGPGINYLFAWVLALMLFGFWGLPVKPEKHPLVIARVEAARPAAGAGLKEGDRIVSIDGHNVESYDHYRRIVGMYLQGCRYVQGEDRVLSLDVMRGDELVNLDWKPRKKIMEENGDGDEGEADRNKENGEEDVSTMEGTGEDPEDSQGEEKSDNQEEESDTQEPVPSENMEPAVGEKSTDRNPSDLQSFGGTGVSIQWPAEGDSLTGVLVPLAGDPWVVGLHGPQARKSGLEVGDRILYVDGHKLESKQQLKEALKGLEKGYRCMRGMEKALVAGVWRGGQKDKEEDVKIYPDENGLIGVVFEDVTQWENVPVGRRLAYASGYPIRKSRHMLSALGELFSRLFSGANGAGTQISGPVGIVVAIKTQIRQGFVYGLTVVMFLSVMLGLFNLLPIPALDGGHLLFRFVELITGKRLSQSKEARIHQVALLLLLVLFILVTVKDCRGLFGV